jgi:RNA polymerase sigma-70 factor (ECF subfamily)
MKDVTVDEHEALARQFARNRTHLRAVAYRMLGISAFLAASRKGDFDALLAVLDPDVVVRADLTAERLGASKEVRGAYVVAAFFKGCAQGARPALVDGAGGAVWAQRGRPRVAVAFTVERGKIVAIDRIGDPAHLARLDLVFDPA